MKKLLAVIIICILLLTPALAGAVPLDEFYSIIEEHYIENVDSHALRSVQPEHIGDFLGDPYSEYLSPDEMHLLIERFRGSYGGIGVQIIEVDGQIIIEAVFPESPADRAGLLPGDVILRVDDTSVSGLPLEKVSALVRGEEGTPVILELKRNGYLFRRMFNRERIETPTVSGEVIGDVGYIRLESFADSTPASFRRILNKLRIQDPRGYILDLRHNFGGTLDAALEIAEEFLPAGPVVILRDRYGQEAFGNLDDGAPLSNLVVLVNSYSASAAELLAGAIQDYGAGVIMGQQTFGKASVQSLFLLSDGSGLKLTTAHYYTPADRLLDKIGLTPDIIVDDPVLQLRRALWQVRSVSPSLVFGIGEKSVWSTTGTLELESVPILLSGRCYVPLRPLVEIMGATVIWDDFCRKATVRKGMTVIEIPVGQSGDVEAVIRNGRVFIPARAVAEALGGRVWWDAQRLEVIVDWR
jgi:carboxyl-terminal processing protease